MICINLAFGDNDFEQLDIYDGDVIIEKIENICKRRKI